MAKPRSPSKTRQRFIFKARHYGSEEMVQIAAGALDEDLLKQAAKAATEFQKTDAAPVMISVYRLDDIGQETLVASDYTPFNGNLYRYVGQGVWNQRPLGIKKLKNS